MPLNPILIEPTGSGEYYFDPATGTYNNAPASNSTTKILSASVSNQPTKIAPFGWHIGPYFFDCWLNCSQALRVTSTKYPVATGAMRSDHAYVEPLEFSFEIGVTNTVANNFFDGASARSVNAYNLLTKLAASLEFVEVGTKYGTYQNILIKTVQVSDTFDTQDKMVALVTLEEQITANTQTYQVSANRQATDKTSRGNVSTVPAFKTPAYTQYYKIDADRRALRVSQ